MYKYRCSVIKDYRFSVSYAAYLLGDRCIREITHLWTYLNPDIQKGAFTSENALFKSIYAAIMQIKKKWTMPVRDWAETLSQLDIYFETRVPVKRG